MAKKNVADPPFAEALRLLRMRAGYASQVAVSKLDGAPDYRTLSHWETGRKRPSLPLLWRYLVAIGRDFSDLQAALDATWGKPNQTLERITDLERRVSRLEGASVPLVHPAATGSTEPN